MGRYSVATLSKLVDQFERMPGIGHKSAQRLAFHVLNMTKQEAENFSKIILEAHEKIKKGLYNNSAEVCKIYEELRGN